MDARAPPADPCQIGEADGLVRGFVGPGHAGQVQRCYESWAMTCLRSHCGRAMLVGRSGSDAFSHLAARDVLASMVLAGVPQDFRVALVALDAHMIAVYDAVVVEAGRCGIAARRFRDEPDARRWLMET